MTRCCFLVVHPASVADNVDERDMGRVIARLRRITVIQGLLLTQVPTFLVPRSARPLLPAELAATMRSRYEG